MTESHDRRKEDGAEYQRMKVLVGIGKALAAVVGILATLGFASFWINDTRYVTKAEMLIEQKVNGDCHDKLQGQVTVQDKTMAVVLTKLDNIQKTLDEIKATR